MLFPKVMERVSKLHMLDYFFIYIINFYYKCVTRTKKTQNEKQNMRQIWALKILLIIGITSGFLRTVSAEATSVTTFDSAILISGWISMFVLAIITVSFLCHRHCGHRLYVVGNFSTFSTTFKNFDGDCSGLVNSVATTKYDTSVRESEIFVQSSTGYRNELHSYTYSNWYQRWRAGLSRLLTPFTSSQKLNNKNEGPIELSMGQRAKNNKQAFHHDSSIPTISGQSNNYYNFNPSRKRPSIIRSIISMSHQNSNSRNKDPSGKQRRKSIAYNVMKIDEMNYRNYVSYERSVEAAEKLRELFQDKKITRTGFISDFTTENQQSRLEIDQAKAKSKTKMRKNDSFGLFIDDDDDFGSRSGVENTAINMDNDDDSDLDNLESVSVFNLKIPDRMRSASLLSVTPSINDRPVGRKYQLPSSANKYTEKVQRRGAII